MIDMYALMAVVNEEAGMLAMFADKQWCNYVAEMLMWTGVVEQAICVFQDSVSVPIES